MSQIGDKVILAGDFNARDSEWGMTDTNAGSRAIMEIASRRGLIVQNTGTVTTNRRSGFGESMAGDQSL